jgi:site-specific recombinase XerC
MPHQTAHELDAMLIDEFGRLARELARRPRDGANIGEPWRGPAPRTSPRQAPPPMAHELQSPFVSQTGETMNGDQLPQIYVPQPRQPEPPPRRPDASAMAAGPHDRSIASWQVIAGMGADQPPQFRVKGRKSGQPALINDADLARVFASIDAHSPSPIIDRLMVLLTLRAGLRPCEVAGLQIRTLLTASGELLDYILVMPGTAKRGRQRTIPMHPELREALLRFLDEYPQAERIALRFDPQGHIIYRSIAAVTQRYKTIYVRAGLQGYSAMSGRHSFATGLHRLSVPALDIQRLLGHKRLSTTSIYLRPDDVSAEVIGQLGSAPQAGRLT